MKIIHSSDILLGKKFVGLKLAGDRLRAGLKSALSRIIDYTLDEKADLLLIVGNLFDTLEVSKNLQDFVAIELSRLETIPAVILPGQHDYDSSGSFWKSWEGFRSQSNIYVFNGEKPYYKFEQLDCTVYGFPYSVEGKRKNYFAELSEKQDTKSHIAMVCIGPDDLSSQTQEYRHNEPPIAGFDYVALGGQPVFTDLSFPGFRAAYSGAPEQLDFSQKGAGHIARIDIDESKNVKLEKVSFGKFVWRTEEVQAKEILNNEDLINKIKTMADPDLLLRLKFSGLTLFEAGIGSEYVQRLMEKEFLYLDIVDEMTVLPENVSEVKVSEKTLLGQYIKVMADQLNKADDNLKSHLEKSLKIGFALLQGRELW